MTHVGVLHMREPALIGRISSSSHHPPLRAKLGLYLPERIIPPLRGDRETRKITRPSRWLLLRNLANVRREAFLGNRR